VEEVAVLAAHSFQIHGNLLGDLDYHANSQAVLDETHVLYQIPSAPLEPFHVCLVCSEDVQGETCHSDLGTDLIFQVGEDLQ